MPAARPLLVISGVVVTEAGPLNVFRDCLDAARREFAGAYRIVALVHSRALFKSSPGIHFVEFPWAKHSYVHRLWCEYVSFSRLSQRLRPRAWLSIHDTSPNVSCPARAVYCHNPSALTRPSLRDIFFEPKLLLFHLLYRLVYAINLRKNRVIVVQQDRIRERFMAWFGLERSRIVVAYPRSAQPVRAPRATAPASDPMRFIYPAFPRPFKNFELIGAATEQLVHSGVTNFEVILTIAGTETRYARFIRDRYSHLAQITFTGWLPRERLFALYRSCDYLVFPSKLETWGLPLSEAIDAGLGILAARLPYARETIGDYDKVRFFDPGDARALADLMRAAIQRSLTYDRNVAPPVTEPRVDSWEALMSLLRREADRAAATAQPRAA